MKAWMLECMGDTPTRPGVVLYDPSEESEDTEEGIAQKLDSALAETKSPEHSESASDTIR